MFAVALTLHGWTFRPKFTKTLDVFKRAQILERRMGFQSTEKVLFKEGDPSTGAFLVEGGQISISGTHIPKVNLDGVNVDGNNLLVGVLELFLAQGADPGPRLCTLFASSDSRVSEVPFRKVLSRLTDYDEGSNANRFLAQFLERTNDLIRTMFRLMPKQWRGYQEQAILYYGLVNCLDKIATTSGVSDYKELVRESQNIDLYSVGSRFRQERSISCIAFALEWLTSAQRFSKEQAICRAGDVADCMYILLEGNVYVAKPNQIFASINKPGECFGELAFFLKGKRTADLIATPGTSVLRLDAGSLREFHASHPDMFIQIAATLAKRIEANLQTLERHRATNPQEAAKEAEALNQSARKVVDTFLEKIRRFLRIASNLEVSELVNYAQDEMAKID